ncbi:MAG: hypothetical protein ACRDO2_04935 [Nocardioidaceae bacterium]
MTEGLLHTYMNDHLAAATAGEQLFHRAANNQSSRHYGPELHALAASITEDRARLRTLMTRLAVSENKPKQLLARAAEYAGRVKPNRFVLRRSPLSDLLEIEAMRTGVTAKQAGWRALLASEAADDPLVKDELTDLQHRAEEQAQQLDRLHEHVANRVLGGGGAHE